MTLPGHLVSELDEQEMALRRRIAQSNMYTHEVAEFGVARRALQFLWKRLSIDEDLGSLTTSESRNIVRKVRLSDGSLAVVKVSGNAREPGEGDVLTAWAAAGLPCIEPIDFGYMSIGSTGDPATYVMTRYLDAPTVGGVPDAATLSDRLALAERLVDFIGQFHRAGTRVPRTRSWEDRLWLHLRWSLPPVRAHGLPEAADWEAKLRSLAGQGTVVVHGDPAGNNVLQRTASDLVLFDPPGAIRAVPEADVAQICSQVGKVDHVEEMIAHVCDQHPRLDPSAVSCLAGINFLVWAGYCLADHPSPDAPAQGVPGASAEAQDTAERYLRVAAGLIDRYSLG